MKKVNGNLEFNTQHNLLNYNQTHAFVATFNIWRQLFTAKEELSAVQIQKVTEHKSKHFCVGLHHLKSVFEDMYW